MELSEEKINNMSAEEMRDYLKQLAEKEAERKKADEQQKLNDIVNDIMKIKSCPVKGIRIPSALLQLFFLFNYVKEVAHSETTAELLQNKWNDYFNKPKSEEYGGEKFRKDLIVLLADLIKQDLQNNYNLKNNKLITKLIKKLLKANSVTELLNTDDEFNFVELFK